jgi:hypothetical protein
MAWNSRWRYSPSTSRPVAMYLRTRGPTSGFSRSAIEGAVSNRAAGDVLQVAHHGAVVRRRVVLAGVGEELVGKR